MENSKGHTNDAFSNEDDIDLGQIPEANINRANRAQSSISRASNASKTSRSSVNCTNGTLKCPNLRLQKFFSYKDGGLNKCVNSMKETLSSDNCGNILGEWLLIEINHWDLHREKVVILTETCIFILTYDFINDKLKCFKKILLANVKSVTYGSLTYPNTSLMGKYPYGAVKICWNDVNGNFLKKWNPFTDDAMPFLILTSHHILYNQKENDTTLYNCDDFIGELEVAVNRTQTQTEQKIEFLEAPIQIDSYFSLVSILYNQNWLGFQLDRNGVNF